MSNYTKATNFATKDTLPTGDANKIVKGTEIDNEFTAIAGAITSKADLASPTFTGTPAAPTAAAGTNTTQVASTAFVFAERTNTSTLTNKTLTSPVINTPTINTPTISTPAITGGTITGITDLTVADGGTGSSTLAANEVLLGNGTSALQTVAPSTNGNVLTSNGTTWTSASPSYIGNRGQAFTASGTFTIPTQITAIKVTVQSGGGGGGGGSTDSGTAGGSGGGGANAVTFYTGLTPANTLSVTVGAGGAGGGTGSGSGASGTAGGTSSITSGTQSITATTCTGGGAGIVGGNGAGGSATGASFSINGASGANGRGQSAMSTNLTGYGLGGLGGDPGVAGTAGTAGIVIVEW